MYRTPEKVLKTYSLKKTPVRMEVLEVLMDESRAFSHRELEIRLEKSADRVTIYRTLNSFEEKGLIHRVMDDDQVTKYALSHDLQHSEDHIHFKCDICGKTFCVEDCEIPRIRLPGGYKTESVTVFARGTCAECSAG